MILEPDLPTSNGVASIWPTAGPIIDTAEHPATSWPPPRPRQLTWRSNIWTRYTAYTAGHYYEIAATVDPDCWTIQHAKAHRYETGQPMISIGRADTIEEAKAAAERHLQTELALAGAVEALAMFDEAADA